MQVCLCNEWHCSHLTGGGLGVWVGGGGSVGGCRVGGKKGGMKGRVEVAQDKRDHEEN